MASGDLVVQVLEVMQPATLAAEWSVRAGGSTPAERLALWAFDGTTAEYMDFKCKLRGYAGGGLTLALEWMGATAITGSTRWEAAIRRLDDDVEDIDAAHTYDFNGVTDVVASASGELSYPTITFTNGADMDSLANGEEFILRWRRDPANAEDTMVGDAQLIGFDGRET